MAGRLRSEQVAGINRNARPTSSEYAATRKRIIRTLIEEIVVRVED
jgi:hypothetical protein